MAVSLSGGYGGIVCATMATRLRSVQTLMAKSPLLRFSFVYSTIVCGVAAWRGTWSVWDYLTEQGTGTKAVSPSASERYVLASSGLVSHVVSLVVLVRLGYLSSALAPPARLAVISDFEVWSARTCSAVLPDLAGYSSRVLPRLDKQPRL